MRRPRVSAPPPGKITGAAGLDPIGAKVEALLSRMSLEDKVMQMVQPAWGGAITGPTRGDDAGTAELVRRGIGSLLNVGNSSDVERLQKIATESSPLGIPLLIAHDVIYGDRTIGPVPLAMAGSFDPQVARQVARVAAVEARARGVALTFAPMLDVTSDPRWGRIVEGWGSSPHLAGVMGAANISGFHEGGLATTAKHFAGYGYSDGGIDYGAVHVSKARLENEILPPFERAVIEGVDAVMPAFNSLNGVPCTADGDLLNTKLRREWFGEDIITVSDYTAIMELIHHGVARDRKHAAELAALAGVDIDMESGIYAEHLADLVREGLVPERVVDDANRRILRLKHRLGLFERADVDPELEARVVLSPEHRSTMRVAAERSMVLLKNEPAVPGGAPLLPIPRTAWSASRSSGRWPTRATSSASGARWGARRRRSRSWTASGRGRAIASSPTPGAAAPTRRAERRCSRRRLRRRRTPTWWWRSSARPST